jgi:hypothetical protein
MLAIISFINILLAEFSIEFYQFQGVHGSIPVAPLYKKNYALIVQLTSCSHTPQTCRWKKHPLLVHPSSVREIQLATA